MKKIRNLKTICLSLVAMVLILSMGVGSAIAYFTSNTNSLGSHEMNLEFAYAEIIEKVEPGLKEIVIENTGNVDCYVRMRAFAGTGCNLTYSGSADSNMATIDGWIQEGDYYKYVGGENGGILKPDEKTTSIYVHFTAPADASEYNVIIIQECTPVLYNNNGESYADWDAKSVDDGGNVTVE